MRALWHLEDCYNQRMLNYVRDVVREEAPDVASVHNLRGWSVATWTALNDAGIPIVQVLHDYYLICPRTTMFKNGSNCTGQCRSCAMLRLPHRRLSRRVGAVVGVSRFVLDAHRRLGYFDGVPVQCVIHDTRAAASLGSTYISDVTQHTGSRFGYIGALTPSKGVSELIGAFMGASLPDSELWIAGSGSSVYERYLRAQANGDTRIHFLGRVVPAEFYPHIDVVVVPSIWNDNLPGVVYEAFAFGKPVIGCRRGGIPEMIVDGRNGWLFDPSRPGELIARLQRVVTEPDQLLRAGINARADAAPYLDVRSWTARYIDVYSRLLGQAQVAKR
jgi:glycosyltransferase involved in cell wall biosynthesis